MSSEKFMKGFWSVLISLVLVSAVSIAPAKGAGYGSTEKQGTEMTREGHQMMEKSTADIAVTTDISGRAGYLQSAKKVMGLTVQNLQGEKLGRIHELIIDESKDSVVYVIVSERGKLYPVPWKAFGTGEKSYTLDITTKNFRQAPTIESVDINRLSSPDLRHQVGDFYAKQISVRESVGERAVGWMKEKAGRALGTEERPDLYKCSEAFGTDIQNMKGEKIARFSDIVFDVREGNLAYGLGSFGGYMGIAAKTAAVPWSAITLNHPVSIAKLDADRSALETAVIARGDLNKLNDPQFARKISQDFGREPYWEVFGYVPPESKALTVTAWMPGSDYNKSFNAATITTFEGTVKGVESFTPEKGSVSGLKLKVDTPEGKTMVIHGGPEKFYPSQNIRFNDGDKITVTGSKTRIGLTSVIIATEIKKGDDTFKLRDADGTPLWKAEMAEEPTGVKEMKPTPNKTE